MNEHSYKKNLSLFSFLNIFSWYDFLARFSFFDAFFPHILKVEIDYDSSESLFPR